MSDEKRKRTIPRESPEADVDVDANCSEDSKALYLHYREFVTALGRDGPERCDVLRKDDFERWWRGLPPKTRRVLEQDFRRGYGATLREGRQQVRSVIEKYGGGRGTGDAEPKNPLP